MWLFLVGSGYLADVVRARGYMSTTWVRKTMTAVGQFAVHFTNVLLSSFLPADLSIQFTP